MNRLLITQLSVAGMRSLDSVELELTTPVTQAGVLDREAPAPTVLIGPNGTGKSTLIEVCELLRKAGTERPFVGKLFDAHGGPPALLRASAKRLEIGARFASPDGSELSYRIALRTIGRSLTIESEVATSSKPGGGLRYLLKRSRDAYSSAHSGTAEIEHPIEHDDDLVLATAAFHVPELKAIQDALASIEVHTAIEVRAPWTSSSDAGPRASNIVRPVTRVEPGGRNLPNVYHALRIQKDWPQTLDRIRIALGDQIEDVVTPADPSGGRIALEVRVAGVGSVPAFAMSDGQLAYLALLGALRLQRPAPPALVAFDEPDLHLHPSLARRLMSDLETFARTTSVLVATQSDAMLDALTEPARASVLCELDEHHATQLVRPDPDSLRRWLEDYRGLGELRAAGYESAVFPTLQVP